jgi:hypothetical protein
MKLTTKKGKDRFPTLRRLGEFNLDYWILRSMLVSVVLALVLLNWWLGESRHGYRLGEPSPRTYVAIMNTNYLDEESTGLLRRHAADNIVAVMTKDSHAEVRIRDRLEQLKRRNGIEEFSVTLREMLSAMTPARKGPYAASSPGTRVVNP